MLLLSCWYRVSSCGFFPCKEAAEAGSPARGALEAFGSVLFSRTCLWGIWWASRWPDNRVHAWPRQHARLAMVGSPPSCTNTSLIPCLTRLFMIEGMATVIVSLVAIFVMPGQTLLLGVRTRPDLATRARRLPSHNSLAIGGREGDGCVSIKSNAG